MTDSNLILYAVRLPAPDANSFDVYVVGPHAEAGDQRRQPLQVFTDATVARQRAESMATPSRGEYEVVAVPVTGDLTALQVYSDAALRAERRFQEQITHQRGQITRLQEELRNAEQRHRADIERIGERLIEEAEQREWCGEYDAIVDDLNRSLQVELPRRMRQYRVTEQWVVTVQTITEASDEDEAREYEFDSDQIAEAVSEGHYSLVSDSTRVERV
jgi:hypothetical protein